MEKHSLPVHVQAPAPLAGVGVGLVLPLREVEVPVVAGRLVGMHARAAELFDEQDKQYRDSVLPPAVKARVSVEAGSTYGWERYTTTDGAQVGVDSFGASAPAPTLYEKFGITKEAVVAAAKKVAGK